MKYVKYYLLISYYQLVLLDLPRVTKARVLIETERSARKLLSPGTEWKPCLLMEASSGWEREWGDFISKDGWLCGNQNLLLLTRLQDQCPHRLVLKIYPVYSCSPDGSTVAFNTVFLRSLHLTFLLKAPQWTQPTRTKEIQPNMSTQETN